MQFKQNDPRLNIPCVDCGAGVQEHCFTEKGDLVGFHQIRRRQFKQMIRDAQGRD